MVDEGLSGSLDWHEQSLQNNTLPRTLGILWILMEKRKVENEDNEDHDEDEEGINVELDKEGTYY